MVGSASPTTEPISWSMVVGDLEEGGSLNLPWEDGSRAVSQTVLRLRSCLALEVIECLVGTNGLRHAVTHGSAFTC